MLRNVLKYSDILKLYCIHVITLYGSVMIILRWCCDYLLNLTYTWINKSYDSDDLPLIQMVIQSNSEINDEGKNVDNEEDDANFAEVSDEGENEGTFLFVIGITSLR